MVNIRFCHFPTKAFVVMCRVPSSATLEQLRAIIENKLADGADQPMSGFDQWYTMAKTARGTAMARITASEDEPIDGLGIIDGTEVFLEGDLQAPSQTQKREGPKAQKRSRSDGKDVQVKKEVVKKEEVKCKVEIADPSSSSPVTDIYTARKLKEAERKAEKAVQEVSKLKAQVASLRLSMRTAAASANKEARDLRTELNTSKTLFSIVNERIVTVTGVMKAAELNHQVEIAAMASQCASKISSYEYDEEELEEKVTELEGKVDDLEEENEGLKNTISVMEENYAPAMALFKKSSLFALYDILCSSLDGPDAAMSLIKSPNFGGIHNYDQMSFHKGHQNLYVTPIRLAIYTHRLDVARAIVALEVGFSILTENVGGALPTLLHIAADRNNHPAAQYLLAKGVNMNERNNVNMAPIHIALRAGNHGIASLLRKRGCPE